MALELTQHLTEMCTSNLTGGKGQPVCKVNNIIANFERVSRKCGGLIVSQPYGPPRPVSGITLLFYYYLHAVLVWESQTQALVML
jgi:hypothetical protein